MYWGQKQENQMGNVGKGRVDTGKNMGNTAKIKKHLKDSMAT